MLKDGSGWGAHVGVTAALLARDGFTGAPALTVEGDAADACWHDLGTRWRIREQYFKPYPVCRWAQPAIEAALSLQRTHDFDADDVAAIAIESFREAIDLGSQCLHAGDHRRGAVQPALPGRGGAGLRPRRRDGGDATAARRSARRAPDRGDDAERRRRNSRAAFRPSAGRACVSR